MLWRTCEMTLLHQVIIIMVISSNLILAHLFIRQGISTRRQRSDIFGLRVKLSPVTTSLTTQR